MTAHIFNSKLDPKYPATLSKNIITGILREQLGYDGVVISDDMQMGAIRNDYGYEQAVELAIHAGVDILAIANNLVYEPDIGVRTAALIKQMVADGRVSPERIEQSYQRIMKLKARL
jgi:beta-N-acetylhexosaminidase